MLFKVKIDCCQCNCSFELSPKTFSQREHLECPNCGQAFPRDAFSALKDGMLSLSSVPHDIPGIDSANNCGLKNSGFYTSVIEVEDPLLQFADK